MCAGINRHEVEDERALQERSSDPLGLESCAATARDTVRRRQRIGGLGIQLRKYPTRAPTFLICAVGNTNRGDSASLCSARRSRRPQDTPINFMHENRETSEIPAVKPDSRSAGEGDSRTAHAYVSEESHSGIVPMNYSNNDKTSSAESREGRPLIKENAGQPNTYPTQSGKGVSQGLAGVRKAARENKEMRFGVH